MSVLPGQTLYYVEDYSDEVMPCEPTLAGWAAWLGGKHDGGWGLDAPPADGTTFDVNAMTMREDVIARREPDGSWSFSHALGDATFVAVRFGAGLGWDADSILWSEDFEGEMRAWLADLDNVAENEDEVIFAVAKDELAMVGTFYAGPPPRFEVVTKQ